MGLRCKRDHACESPHYILDGAKRWLVNREEARGNILTSFAQADLISAWVNREHSTRLAVTEPRQTRASETADFKSSARWRRSQLPLASSQSRRERTLARAKAIAQSAAP